MKYALCSQSSPVDTEKYFLVNFFVGYPMLCNKSGLGFCTNVKNQMGILLLNMHLPFNKARVHYHKCLLYLWLTELCLPPSRGQLPDGLTWLPQDEQALPPPARSAEPDSWRVFISRSADTVSTVSVWLTEARAGGGRKFPCPPPL